MQTTEPLPVYQLDSYLALEKWRRAEAAASNIRAQRCESAFTDHHRADWLSRISAKNHGDAARS